MAITKRQPEVAPGPEEKDFYDYLGTALEVGGMIAGGALAASATGGMSLAAMPAIMAGATAGRGVGNTVTGLFNPEKAEGNKQLQTGLGQVVSGVGSYAAAQPKVAATLFNDAVAEVQRFKNSDQTGLTFEDKMKFWNKLTDGKPFSAKQNAGLAAELGFNHKDFMQISQAQTLGAQRIPSPSALSLARKKQLMQMQTPIGQQMQGTMGLQRPQASGMGEWRQMWPKINPGQPMPPWMTQPEFQQNLYGHGGRGFGQGSGITKNRDYMANLRGPISGLTKIE